MMVMVRGQLVALVECQGNSTEPGDPIQAVLGLRLIEAVAVAMVKAPSVAASGKI